MVVLAKHNPPRNNTKIVDPRVVAYFYLICIINTGFITYLYTFTKKLETHFLELIIRQICHTHPLQPMQA